MKPDTLNSFDFSHRPSRAVFIWLLGLVSFWLLLEIPGYVVGRPFYDDEFDPVFMSRLSFVDIVKKKYLDNDPHPFGHFIFLKALFEIFGAREGVAFGGSLFVAALSLVFFFLSYLKLGGSNKLLGLVVLGLNPLFLLHGSAVRWYPLWSFLAAASFYLLIRNSKPSSADVCFASVLTAVAFYVNYLAVVYSFGIMVWLLFQREFKKAGLFVFVATLLCLPWATTFLRHFLEGSASQFRGKNALSLLYTAFVVVAGETMSPAHWLSWILWFGSLVPLLCIHLLLGCQDKRQQLIFILCGSALLLPLLLGFGFTKARSFMFYSGTLYLFIALVLDKNLTSKNWNLSSLAKVSLVCTLTICVLGFIHLSKGLYYHKQGLSDPIRPIVNQVQLWAQEVPTAVFTSNPVLVYYLSHLPEFPRRIQIITPYERYIDGQKPRGDLEANGEKPFRRVVLIYSYLGSLDSSQTYARHEAFREMVASWFENSVEVHIKPDPEYQIKRRIFPDAHLGPYRFVLKIIPQVDQDQLALLKGKYEHVWADRG